MKRGLSGIFLMRSVTGILSAWRSARSYTRLQSFIPSLVCEKCAKGCLALSGIMIARDHHVSDLFNSSVIPVSGDLKAKFQQSLVFMSRLESYYIPSRYGVDTAGRVHYLKYDPDSVRELSQAANDFLELCLEFFEIRTGTSLPRLREHLEEYFLANYSHCIRRLE